MYSFHLLNAVNKTGLDLHKMAVKSIKKTTMC